MKCCGCGAARNLHIVLRGPEWGDGYTFFCRDCDDGSRSSPGGLRCYRDLFVDAYERCYEEPAPHIEWVGDMDTYKIGAGFFTPAALLQATARMRERAPVKASPDSSS